MATLLCNLTHMTDFALHTLQHPLLNAITGYKGGFSRTRTPNPQDNLQSLPIPKSHPLESVEQAIGCVTYLQPTNILTEPRSILALTADLAICSHNLPVFKFKHRLHS